MHPKHMTPLKWPINKEESAYMRERKRQNRSRTRRNSNENWAHERLCSLTGLKWTRQAMWGYRLYDNWNAVLGVAVEVDGLEHKYKRGQDLYRDEYNFRRSGIVVLRVRNQNEIDMAFAVDLIRKSRTWEERRNDLGLFGCKANMKRWIVAQGNLFDEAPSTRPFDYI